jgi:hypothetical protein
MFLFSFRRRRLLLLRVMRMCCGDGSTCWLCLRAPFALLRLPPRSQVFDDLCHGFLMFAAMHEPSKAAAMVCAGWIRDVINGDDFATTHVDF